MNGRNRGRLFDGAAFGSRINTDATDLYGFNGLMRILYNGAMTTKKIGKLLYEDESYKIRGACFQVYNALGGGIKEKIIERALSAELRKQGMEVGHQVRINLSYLGEKIGTYIPDLVVNEKIMIELKSKPFISQEDYKQFWGYLKGSSYELGFLIAFTPRKLVIKRFIHTTKKSSV